VSAVSVRTVKIPENSEALTLRRGKEAKREQEKKI